MLIVYFILTSKLILQKYTIFTQGSSYLRNPFNSPEDTHMRIWRIMVLKGSSIKLWWFCREYILNPRDGSVLGKRFLSAWWCWRHKEHLSLGSSFSTYHKLWLHHFSALVSKLYDYSTTSLWLLQGGERELQKLTLLYCHNHFPPFNSNNKKIIEFLLLLGHPPKGTRKYVGMIPVLNLHNTMEDRSYTWKDK